MDVDVFLDILRSIVLFIVFIISFSRLRLKKDRLCMVFFSMAVASLFLSDIYWMVYDSLRAEMRMPFAANEISEWAFFMLLGASLNDKKTIDFKKAKVEMVCAVLFAVANVVFWIGWSSEWIQDIVTGIVFAYFICIVVAKMKTEEAFLTWQWIALGIDCLLLVAGQTATFLVPEQIKRPVDLCCYGLLLSTVAVFILRAFLSFRDKIDREKGVCYSFSSFAWIVVTMYMSEGIFYNIAMALSIICFPLMYFSLKREVFAE